MKPIEKEFCQGVKILLERMKNNPEDFVGGDDPYRSPKFGVFHDLMGEIVRGDKVKHWEDWYLLTKEEQSALIQGFKDMKRTCFDKGIMRKLLEEPEEPIVKKEYYGKPLTAAQITNEALRVLEKEFTNNSPMQTKTPTKLMLGPAQTALANKLGLTPAEYARKLNKI